MTTFKLPNLTEKQASKLSLYLGLAAGYESEKGNREKSIEILRFAEFIIDNTEPIEDTQTTEVTRTSDSRIKIPSRSGSGSVEVLYDATKTPVDTTKVMAFQCPECKAPEGGPHAKSCIAHLTTPLREEVVTVQDLTEETSNRIDPAFLPGGELFLSDGAVEEGYLNVVNCVTTNVQWNSLKAITKRVREKGGMGAMQSQENEEGVKDFLDHAVLIGDLHQPKSGYWIKPEDAIAVDFKKLRDKDKAVDSFTEFSM